MDAIDLKDNSSRNKLIASLVVIVIALSFVVWQLWPSGTTKVFIATDNGKFESTFRDELGKKGYLEFQYISILPPAEGETGIVIAGTVKTAKDLETVKAVASSVAATLPQVKYRVDTQVKP